MISLVAAIQRDGRGIGRKGDLIWSIADDMRRFRELTKGAVVVMGRKTWESLPPKFRPLPGRVNLVVTRNASYEAPGATVYGSVDDALALAAAQFPEKECCVIGGGDIYALALPKADRLLLTVIDGKREADAFFPAYESAGFRLVSREERTEASTGTRYAYEEWVR